MICIKAGSLWGEEGRGQASTVIRVRWSPAYMHFGQLDGEDSYWPVGNLLVTLRSSIIALSGVSSGLSVKLLYMFTLTCDEQ